MRTATTLVIVTLAALLAGCPRPAPRAGTPQVNLPLACTSASVVEGASMSACPAANQIFTAATDDLLVRRCDPAVGTCVYANFRWYKFKNINTTTHKVEVCTAPKVSGDAAASNDCRLQASDGQWAAMLSVPKAQVTRADAPPLQGSFTAAPESGVAPLDVTLSWAVQGLTGATPCQASGGWSGSKPASGTQTIDDLLTTTSFSLSCGSTAPNAVMLSWKIPTTNTDGSALTGITAFLIGYGDKVIDGTPALEQSVTTQPDSTSYVINNLAAKTWYFSIRTLANNTASDWADIISYNVSPAGAAAVFDKTITVTVTAKPNPPSDFNASQPEVFRLNQRPNQLTIEQVGVVAVGTPCDPAQTAMGKYVIDRNSIELEPGQVLPDVVLATCAKTGTWQIEKR